MDGAGWGIEALFLSQMRQQKRMQARSGRNGGALGCGGAVVNQRGACLVREQAARFLHNQVGGRQVPVALDRQTHHGVMLAIRHQRDTIGDGAVGGDLHHRPAACETCPGTEHARPRDSVTIRDMNCRPVQQSAAALPRRETFFADGIVNHGRLRPPRFHHRGADGEMRPVPEKGNGAVNRVHHKDARRGQPRRVVEAFFRQPAITGPRRQKFFLEEIVHRQIGFGDRAAAGLGPMLEIGAVEFSRNLARPAHTGFQKFKVLFRLFIVLGRMIRHGHLVQAVTIGAWSIMLFIKLGRMTRPSHLIWAVTIGAWSIMLRQSSCPRCGQSARWCHGGRQDRWRGSVGGTCPSDCRQW